VELEVRFVPVTRAAKHREELSQYQTDLLQKNTDLTEQIHDLAEQLRALTEQVPPATCGHHLGPMPGAAPAAGDTTQ
jgi:hypothetical protein